MDQMQQPESPDQISGKNTGKTTIEVCDEVNMHRGQCLLEPGHDGRHFYRGDVPTCWPKWTGEPQFNIVGRDKLAVGTLKEWIEQANDELAGPEKLDQAIQDLAKFEKWQAENPDKVKLPD